MNDLERQQVVAKALASVRRNPQLAGPRPRGIACRWVPALVAALLTSGGLVALGVIG